MQVSACFCSTATHDKQITQCMQFTPVQSQSAQHWHQSLLQSFVQVQFAFSSGFSPTRLKDAERFQLR